MQRILYAIHQALNHKKQLHDFLVNKKLSTQSITGLTPEYFESRHIKYIALDFDGVLANHGAVKPLKEAEDWLIKLTQKIPLSHIAILSNKPFSQRLQYIQKKFPELVVISGVPKKPYPEGLNKLLAHFQCQKNELALVDDRLLTGMLAVCLAGVEGVYISKAYNDFREKPIAESFFALLRKVERSWIRWLS